MPHLKLVLCILMIHLIGIESSAIAGKKDKVIKFGAQFVRPSPISFRGRSGLLRTPHSSTYTSHPNSRSKERSQFASQSSFSSRNQVSPEETSDRNTSWKTNSQAAGNFSHLRNGLVVVPGTSRNDQKSSNYLPYLLAFSPLSTVLLNDDDSSRYPGFDNYFLELVTQQGDTQFAEEQIELALSSIIKRIRIPYTEDNEVKVEHFFEALAAHVESKYPGTEVYISGGVVRSLLGYLYQEVYKRKRINPEISTQEAITEIISSTENIDSLIALGQGPNNDLDILIIPSSNDSKKEDSIKRDIEKFISSGRLKFNLSEIESDLDYLFIPVPDVLDYHKQIERTSRQGGSSLDWLAFPISGGKMRVPEADPAAFKNFVLGQYHYLPPQDIKYITDADKQLVRGLRPLFEIPFLVPTESGEKQLKKELGSTLERIEKGGYLSHAAQLQFQKLIRASRFRAGNNRIYRSNRELEMLILKLTNRLGRSKHIPQFAKYNDPDERKNRDRCNLKSQGVLLEKAEFLNKYTREGELSHGTHVKNYRLIANQGNGFILSTSKQGTAFFGPGVYTTDNVSLAKGYGTVIELKLRQEADLRVIDWNQAQNHPEISNYLQNFNSNFEKTVNWLTEKCDVDIIINGHVLVHNLGVIEELDPKGIFKFYSSYLNLGISDESLINRNYSKAEVKYLFYRLKTYEKKHQTLLELAKLYQVEDILPFPSTSQVAEALLKNISTTTRIATVSTIASMPSPEVDVQLLLIDSLKDSDENVRSSVAKALLEIHPKDPKVFHKLIHLLDDSNPQIRLQVVQIFRGMDPTFGEIMSQSTLSQSEKSTLLEYLTSEATVLEAGWGETLNQKQSLFFQLIQAL